MGDTHGTQHQPAVGLRHANHERRQQARRRRGRFVWDRRRGERRRQQVRTLLFAAAALVTPSQVMKLYPVHPRVSVSMTSFMALQPERAYDQLIAEAAETYGVDAALIRAVMRTESAFNPLVVSPAGAQGLMQLMPA